MPTSNTGTIAILNQLIGTCRDAEAGFHHAAGRERGHDLGPLFDSCSRLYAGFAADLEPAVRGLGGDPDDVGLFDSLAGPGWIVLRRKHTGEDVIAGCECGQDAAEQSYRGALRGSLPHELRSLVERQYTQLKEAHDRLRVVEAPGPDAARGRRSAGGRPRCDPAVRPRRRLQHSHDRPEKSRESATRHGGA